MRTFFVVGNSQKAQSWRPCESAPGSRCHAKSESRRQTPVFRFALFCASKHLPAGPPEILHGLVHACRCSVLLRISKASSSRARVSSQRGRSLTAVRELPFSVADIRKDESFQRTDELMETILPFCLEAAKQRIPAANDAFEIRPCSLPLPCRRPRSARASSSHSFVMGARR